jgi:hypothetical protein
MKRMACVCRAAGLQLGTVSSSGDSSGNHDGSADEAPAGFAPAGLHELADAADESKVAPSSPLVAGLSTLGIIVLLGGGYLFKDSIKSGWHLWRLHAMPNPPT